MQAVLKALVSAAIILVVTGIGKRLPSISGLVTVMPLTGALALIWMYADNRDNPAVLTTFTRGALWGMGPSILFFVAAYLCVSRGWPLAAVLAVSFGAWFVGALVHQLLLR